MHIEAIPDPTDAIKAATANDLGFGLVVSPPTPFSAVAPFMEYVNMLVVMSVNPGFGGQSFMTEVLPKVEEARNWIESHDLDADIEIDGGVSSTNISAGKNAGATVFVVGSSVFGTPDPAEAIRELRRLIEGNNWKQA
jgi:ribulose-phosphate 3-epimerase